MKVNSSFFGTKTLPEIEVSAKQLETLAAESVSIGLTVPGVQKKLSLHMSEGKPEILTLIGLPAGYILKPQTEEYSQLPEAEDLVMDIAEMMGAGVVPHGIIDTASGPAYICERVDRAGGRCYAMEDFCQLSGRLTEDKYKGSYEKCASIIRKHSVRSGFDITEFYLRLIICFVTGNSDMHLKNFSMIETSPGSREFCLSPAYDLLPVNLVMPEDREETALTLNGKKANLGRRDFLEFAAGIDLNSKAAVNMLESVLCKSEDAATLCSQSMLSDEAKEKMITLMQNRVERLRG